MVGGIGLENLTRDMVNVWDGVPHVAIQSTVPSDLAAGLGGIDMATGASLEQLVADAWIWEVAREFSREFDASQEAISFDTIRDAGLDGNFLGKRHTISRFRKETIGAAIPEASLEVRSRPGRQGDLIRKAKEESDRILSKPKNPLVTADELRQIEKCMAKNR
jgi:trimethylamine:corrinoid methyltransferase-like protein